MKSTRIAPAWLAAVFLAASGCSALPAWARPTPTLWLPPDVARVAQPQAPAAANATALPPAGDLAPASTQALAADQGGAYREDFEDGQAQGWSLEPSWAVQLDGGNHVLAGQAHTWARLNQVFEGDLREAVRVKLVRGRIHLVLHQSGAQRYFIGFSTEGSDLNRQESASQFNTDLASGPSAHAADRWYQVEIVLRGGVLEFSVDGQREWTYTDANPFTSGNIAFEPLEDTVVYVDDIVVTTP